MAQCLVVLVVLEHTGQGYAGGNYILEVQVLVAVVREVQVPVMEYGGIGVSNSISGASVTYATGGSNDRGWCHCQYWKWWGWWGIRYRWRWRFRNCNNKIFNFCTNLDI